jgi:soluble cytochrome b562
MAGGVEVGRISIKVTPDTREFRRDLLDDLKAIEKSVTAKIKVEPDMGNFRSEVAGKTKGMRTSVKVDADVDKNFFRRIGDRIDSIKAPNFGSGINPTGYALILGAIATLAGPVVGLLTTALLAVPGLLAGIIAPIAAISLGMDGMKNAAASLAAPFQSLKDVMNGVNERAFTPMFEKLAGVFPSLERSLPQVSEGIAEVGKSIADSLSNPKNLATLENSFANIGTMFRNAAPGIGDFTTGITNLVNQFSQKMPAIGEWLSGAGTDFMNWIDKISADGTLSTAFDSLGTTIKTVLDGLGSIASKGMDFMGDPEKMKNFEDGLNTIIGLMESIMDLSTQINGWKAPDWLKNTADILNTNNPADGKKREDMGLLDKGEDQLTDWSNITEEPDFGPVKAAWTEFKTWLDGWWSNMTAGASGMWTSITSGASSAWNGAVAAIQGAMGTIRGIVSGLGPMLSGIWANVTSTASSAWNGVVAAVQGAWNGITSAISNGVSQAISFVQNMGSQIVSTITSIDLSAAGAQIVQGLINGISSMIGSAVAKARELASSVAGAVTGFLGIHSPSKLFTEFGENTGQGFELGLVTGFQPVIDQAKSLAERTDLNGVIGPEMENLKNTLASIEQEKKRLKIEKNALSEDDKEGRKALQNQIDQLQAQKDILAYQKDRIKNEGMIAEEGGDDPLVKAAAGLMSAPVDFAKATGKQFLSDIGISGDGMISKAITEGISYIFQIGSVDEALSIKDREESKQALSVVGRQG